MDRNILIAEYRRQGRPLDQLPYSEAFDRLRVAVERASGASVEANRLWRELLKLRKKRQLPRLVRD